MTCYQDSFLLVTLQVRERKEKMKSKQVDPYNLCGGCCYIHTADGSNITARVEGEIGGEASWQHIRDRQRHL